MHVQFPLPFLNISPLVKHLTRQNLPARHLTNNQICGSIDKLESWKLDLKSWKKAGFVGKLEMITTGGIYGIKNYGDENFYYIGKTKNNFYARWGQHIAGISRGSTELPWYSTEKENVDKIDFTILYDCRKTPLESDSELLELEKKFIQEYQPKYNISGRSKEYNKEKKERLVRKIAEEFSDKPLKGETQREFIQRFIDYNLRDESRRKVETFTKACNMIREAGIKIEERQASQKDLKNWENILTKIREKYKIIIFEENI